MGTRAGVCVCFKATTRICGISHIIPATLRMLTKARNVPFWKGQFKRCRNWVSDRPQKYLSRQQAPPELQAVGLQQRPRIKDRTHQDRNQTIAIEERQLIATKHVKHGSRSRSSTGPSALYPSSVARNQDLDTNQRCTRPTAPGGRHKNWAGMLNPQHSKELQNLFYNILQDCSLPKGSTLLLVLLVSFKKKQQLHNFFLYMVSVFIISVFRSLLLYIHWRTDTLTLKCQPTTAIDRTMQFKFM